MSKNATRLRNPVTGQYVTLNDAGALVDQDGSPVGGGGSGALETPAGDVDGVNDTFVASGTITKVFRNGVMEWRLGTPTGNTFVFDTPPSEGDDIEVEV